MRPTSLSRGQVGARIEGGPHQPGRLGAADCLCLAATPAFAIMALLTGASDADAAGGPLEQLCSAAQGGSPVCGMVPMYLLMSAFHSAPWLRLMGQAARRIPNRNHPGDGVNANG